jgi:hypothetical protein
MILKNVTCAKLRAIHRGLRRKGRTEMPLRAWARATAEIFAGDETRGWLAAEAAAFLAKKGARL